MLAHNRVSGDGPSNEDLDDAAFRLRAQTIWNQFARWPHLCDTDFWKDVVVEK